MAPDHGRSCRTIRLVPLCPVGLARSGLKRVAETSFDSETSSELASGVRRRHHRSPEAHRRTVSSHGIADARCDETSAEGVTMNSRQAPRTIVITGASDGVGAASARQLAAERRTGRARRTFRGQDAEARERDRRPLPPGGLRGARPGAATGRRAVRRYPRIDVLANNAGGIMGERGAPRTGSTRRSRSTISRRSCSRTCSWTGLDGARVIQTLEHRRKEVRRHRHRRPAERAVGREQGRTATASSPTSSSPPSCTVASMLRAQRGRRSTRALWPPTSPATRTAGSSTSTARRWRSGPRQRRQGRVGADLAGRRNPRRAMGVWPLLREQQDREGERRQPTSLRRVLGPRALGNGAQRSSKRRSFSTGVSACRYG